MTIDNLTNTKSVHFTGLKGVGMTALACIMDDMGMTVSGSDRPEQYVTDDVIRRRGFRLYSGFAPAHLGRVQLVVFSGGHQGNSNVEVKAAMQSGIPVITLAEGLALAAKGKRVIAVAGVGGKSTTTAMLAQIFAAAGRCPGYYAGVGAIWPQIDPGRYARRSPWFITEADEYFDPVRHCPKFAWLQPETVVVTHLAYDHPDVYRNPQHTVSYFRDWIRKVPDSGLKLINVDTPLGVRLAQTVQNPVTFGFCSRAQYRIRTEAVGGKMQVVIRHPHGHITRFRMGLPGDYHALNAAAAALVARHYRISVAVIRKALTAFMGTKRRFEKIFASGNKALYDDYAHHPDQIRALLRTARNFWPGRRLIVIFQSHTFSRTVKLMDDFQTSFGDCDRVLVYRIFGSAREQGDARALGRQLAKKINRVSHNAVYVDSVREAIRVLADEISGPVTIFTLGAGNLFAWHSQIRTIMKNKRQPRG